MLLRFTLAFSIVAALTPGTIAAGTQEHGGLGLACGHLTPAIAQSVLSSKEALTPIIASELVPSCTYLSAEREINLVMMNEETGQYNSMVAAGWCQAHPSARCTSIATRFAKSKNPSEMYAIIRQAFGPRAKALTGLAYPAMLGPDQKVYVGTKGAVMIFQVRQRTAPYANSWISLPDRAITAAHLVVH